ncbi:hypothetical protein E4U43_004495, partial [Claviceps pusilla]
GDVVRSLQRGRGNGPRYEPYREDDNDNDEEEEEVAEGSGSGSRPGLGSGSAERSVDLEQGTTAAGERGSRRPAHRAAGWLGLFSSNFSGRTNSAHRLPTTE